MTDSAPKLDFEKIYSELQDRAFASLPFPMDRSQLLQAMEAFFAFLDEPEEVKSHIDFSLFPKHRRGDVGFKHREAIEDMYRDNKDFFHFHPAIFEKYRDFLAENPVVLDFVEKALPIWELAYQTVEELLKAFESHFPGTYKRVFSGAHAHVVLRFLKYEWACAGKYLAKPHYDAGALTLALAESNPGLRIGAGPETLTPVEHTDGTALLMLASNMQKVIETEELVPAWHDVIQLDESEIGKPCARWALVAFIDGHNVEALSRDETHKWYAT